MKKDYIPVSDNDSNLSEHSFVEQFWTQKWNDANLLKSVAKDLEGREEFKIIQPFIENLPPNSNILDGGCGLGEWTIYFASKGFNAIGLDISKKTIENLKQKFHAQNFLVGDIRKTDFKDDFFSAYFSWGTFEHFEEGMGACFEEAKRILKKGGYLFISIPYQNGRHIHRDKRNLFKWDENYAKDVGYTSKMRFYQWRLTRPELKREFEINGFRALKIEAIHKLHGLYRMVKHDLHISPNSFPGRFLKRLLYPAIPRDFVAHMIIGIGVKI